MNKFSLLLCGTFLTLPVQAQEEPFQTVITPAFSPVTWERLVNAELLEALDVIADDEHYGP